MWLELLKKIRKLLRRDYYYFASYYWENESLHGYGQCTLIMKRKISACKDTVEIVNDIRLNSNYESVILLNIIKLKKP